MLFSLPQAPPLAPPVYSKHFLVTHSGIDCQSPSLSLWTRLCRLTLLLLLLLLFFFYSQSQLDAMRLSRLHAGAEGASASVHSSRQGGENREGARPHARARRSSSDENSRVHVVIPESRIPTIPTIPELTESFEKRFSLGKKPQVSGVRWCSLTLLENWNLWFCMNLTSVIPRRSTGLLEFLGACRGGQRSLSLGQSSPSWKAPGLIPNVHSLPVGILIKTLLDKGLSKMTTIDIFIHVIQTPEGRNIYSQLTAVEFQECDHGFCHPLVL